MAYVDELRLMAKVARMYYEEDMRQSEIARQLGLSQATISRLFNRAREENIVRITVNTPKGIYVDLEKELMVQYGLRDAIIVDCQNGDDEELIQRDLGSAASYYVESSINNGEIIALSSWSATLLSLVDSMHSIPRKKDVKVVQILGGVGNPSAEVHAARLTGRFSDLVQGEAIYLPAPGVVGAKATRDVFLEDPFVKDAMSLYDQVTMALVGIGSVSPSTLLAESGNIFSEEELDILRQKMAVGDILLRFFDEDGIPIDSSLNDRVVSMELEQLKGIDRAIGIAGGSRKYQAIRGALRGKLINILITDKCTAEKLVNEIADLKETA
jgi:DNA-binding transcriptional regulator LsrR (DeoR family)